MPATKLQKKVPENAKGIARKARKEWKHGQSASSKEGDATGSSAWRRWVEHLGSRKGSFSLPKLLSAQREHPIAWAMAITSPSDETKQFVTTLLSGNTEEAAACAEAWLAEAAEGKPEPDRALEFLAIAHALPRLAATLHADPWWALLEHLTEASEDATALTLEEQPLARELLAGELPLALAYLFPELKRATRLARPAAAMISADMVELLDGEGIIRGADLSIARPLLACWTRVRAMTNEIGPKLLSKDARGQYDWLVRQSMALSRSDGSPVFSSGEALWSKELFTAALTLVDDDDDWLAARWALPSLKVPASAERNGGLPEPAVHSEWAELAHLRSDWSRRSPRLTAVYTQRKLQVELETAGQLVLSGLWDPQVKFNGTLLHPNGEWEEVGWASDDDGDYLELEMTLSNRCRVQRQFFLGRESCILYVADAVLAEEHGRLEYTSVAPLSDACVFQPASESREGQLCTSRPLARVLPLAFPEWRRETSPGEIGSSGGGLQLQYSVDATRLYAPLFIDLEPRRLKKECTWRRLTVAEGLEIQPPDVAVGYRVQIGRRQWLIYRSLAPRGNRTILGQNTTADFLLARFETSGEIETLVELE